MPPRQVLFALEPPVTDFASLNGKASEGFGTKILAASGLDQLGGTAAGQGQGDHYEGEVRNSWPIRAASAWWIVELAGQGSRVPRCGFQNITVLGLAGVIHIISGMLLVN